MNLRRSLCPLPRLRELKYFHPRVVEAKHFQLFQACLEVKWIEARVTKKINYFNYSCNSLWSFKLKASSFKIEGWQRFILSALSLNISGNKSAAGDGTPIFKPSFTLQRSVLWSLIKQPVWPPAPTSSDFFSALCNTLAPHAPNFLCSIYTKHRGQELMSSSQTKQEGKSRGSQ